MRLELIYKTKTLPKFYYKEEVLSPDFDNEGKSYVFIEGASYTYWYEESDKVSWWTGRTVDGLEELIRKYYKGRLVGDTATFPSELMRRKYGNGMAYALEGRWEEWKSNHRNIEADLTRKLDRFLGSPAFKCLKYFARP